MGGLQRKRTIHVKRIHSKTKNGLVPPNTFFGVVTQSSPRLREEP